MSDAERRLRLIAIGFAGVALAVALIAAGIVLRRGESASKKPLEEAKPVVAPLADHKVLATDVVRLQHGAVETVITNGQTIGLRVKDDTLARSLGLEPGDVLTALSGRPLMRELDIYDAVFNVSMMSATTVYAEVLRSGMPTLVRWRLDGDLRQARYGAGGSTLGLLGSTGTGSGLYTTPPPDPPDPLLDTIEKVDDTHVKMPRKTAEHFIQNPMAAAKGARIVPAMKNGKPDGLKLYAIRPSSIYAKIGLDNGDTVHRINGVDVSTPDKMLEAYTKLKDAKEFTLDITRRGQPLTQTITITK